MIGMTLCSGIGAPEMAAPWVDWRLASEIEPFPRAVLQERFGYQLPEDHNQGEPLLWGDMTEVTSDLLHQRGIPLPDLIVAGTPCQAFSIAGLRGGTDDARGNLTLKFVETCHAIVDARPDGKLAVLWENVPGVLSDQSNAFGCFLGGLVGAVDALPPPGDGSWPGEGMVQGPRARAAWAILDAQYFGVAQRRRRVFVVVDFGGCVDPAAVLFEPESLRGNTPTRGQAGKDVAPTISARPTGGGGLGTDFDCDGGLIASEHPYAGTVSAKWAKGSGGPAGDEVQNLVAHTLRGEGFDAGEDGTGRGTPLVPVETYSIMPMNSGKDYKAREVDVAQPSMAGGPVGGNQGGDFVCQPVAFDCKGTEVQTDASGGETPLRSMGHHNSHQNAGGHAAIAIQERAVSENPDAGPDGAGFRSDDAAYTLEAWSVPQAVAFQDRFRGDDGRGYDRPPSVHVEQTGSLETVKPWHVAEPWAVRRLTPTECHRLQGFPDDHCAITYRNKPAADGNQYKALGNSMAVPCIKWIMDRIKASREEMRRAA